MSDEIDGPVRSPSHLEPEAIEPSAPFADVKQAPASWSTFHTAHPQDVVRERLLAGLSRFRAPYEMRQLKSGFVLRSTGRKPFVAEISLTGWEEGTAIHIVIPEEHKPPEKDVAALRTFVEASLKWSSRHA